MLHTEPPDEQLQLQIDRANARSRMRETHETILKLRQILKAYESDYSKWYKRYNNADFELAKSDGRMKRVAPKTDGAIKKVKEETEMTREQILEIAKALGQEVTFND